MNAITPIITLCTFSHKYPFFNKKSPKTIITKSDYISKTKNRTKKIIYA